MMLTTYLDGHCSNRGLIGHVLQVCPVLCPIHYYLLFDMMMLL
jgi:hypothetical protein